MIRCSLIYSFILLSLLQNGMMCGQTCCSGGVPVSSNLGFDIGEPKSLQLSIGLDFNILQSLYTESERINDDFRKRTTQSYLIRAAYTLNTRFSMELMLPWVRQTRNIRTLSGENDFDSTIGIGDPVVLFGYQVINSSHSLSFSIGPQIPLGSYQERNDQGLFLVEDLQPGSGAWDFIFLGSWSHSLNARPSSTVYFNTVVSQNGSNTNSRGGNQTYQFGNDIQLIAGYSDQMQFLGQVVTPGINLRYRSAKRDRIDGFENSGTGGKFLFSSITSEWAFSPKNRLSFQFEWPIYVHVNDTQLAPSYRFGLAYYINIAKNTSSVISNSIRVEP